MWFKLASATFGTHLGSMASLSNSISIKYTATGFNYTTTSITKTENRATLELTLANGYTCSSTPTVSVTGAAKVSGAPTWSSNKLTIAIVPSSGSNFAAGGSIINVSVSGAVASTPSGGTTTKYTITYKYMSGSTSIKTQTTEQVTAGTVKTFSTSGAPSISGYTCSSVSPSGQQTINSNITVTYYYEAAAAFVTKGPYNLFTTTNLTSMPKINANTIRGWSTALGCVPSSFPIAGVRLAIHPSNGTTSETFTKCSKVKVALFALDVDDMVQPANLEATDPSRQIKSKNYTLVAEKEVATDLPLDTTSLVDFVFDTPFVNADNKFLLLTYITETVSAKVISNSKNTWHWVNQNQENEEYETGDAFFNWYFNNTLMSFDWAQFKAASGNGESYSIAYTLFNSAPN